MAHSPKYNQDDIERWIKLAVIAQHHKENPCVLCGNTGRKKDFRLCDCVRRYPYLSEMIGEPPQ